MVKQGDLPLIHPSITDLQLADLFYSNIPSPTPADFYGSNTPNPKPADSHLIFLDRKASK